LFLLHSQTEKKSKQRKIKRNSIHSICQSKLNEDEEANKDSFGFFFLSDTQKKGIEFNHWFK
jgi:hypothetical protein